MFLFLLIKISLLFWLLVLKENLWPQAPPPFFSFFTICQCFKFGQFLGPLPSTAKNGSKICCDIIKAVQFHVSSMTFSGIRAGIMPDACVVFGVPWNSILGWYACRMFPEKKDLTHIKRSPLSHFPDICLWVGCNGLLPWRHNSVIPSSHKCSIMGHKRPNFKQPWKYKEFIINHVLFFCTNHH